MTVRRFLIMREEWDPYAEDCGARIWRKFADLTLNKPTKETDAMLTAIEEGLVAAGQTYAIAEVNSDVYKFRGYLEEIKSYTEDNLPWEDFLSLVSQTCREALGEEQ